MSVLCPLSGQLILYPDRMERLVGAAVWVFLSGTTTPTPVTSDPEGTTPHQFPIRVASDGLVPNIYWGEGPFRVVVTYNTSGAEPNFNNDIILIDMDRIQGEIIITPGGGGGTVLTPDQYFTTGDGKFRFEDGPLDGWVRANGRSIGSAASGATERANADCEDLYIYGWNKWDNAYAPVAGGRGANAAADWAANKPMILLNSLGKALVGLDTMGNTAANISQKSTTINTTNASQSATIANASGIVRGMYVVSANVPAGTTLVSVNAGTGAVTLSNAATATASGTAVRFSTLRDAQAPGATGGASYIHQNDAEMANHVHPLNDPGHDHDFAGGTSDTSGARPRLQNANVTLTSTSAAVTGITMGQAGSGQAMNIMQPSIAGTFYIKL